MLSHRIGYQFQFIRNEQRFSPSDCFFINLAALYENFNGSKLLSTVDLAVDFNFCDSSKHIMVFHYDLICVFLFVCLFLVYLFSYA